MTTGAPVSVWLEQESGHLVEEKCLCGQEKSFRNLCSDEVWIKFIMGPLKCVCICLYVHYSIPKPTNIAVSFFVGGWGLGLEASNSKRRCGCFARRLSVCLLVGKFVRWAVPGSVYLSGTFTCALCVCVLMLSRCWFKRFCLCYYGMRKNKRTLWISVFVPVCVCVLAGSQLGQMYSFLPLSLLFSLSSFLSNHSLTFTVNRRVGKSICTCPCTHTVFWLVLLAWCSILKPPTLTWCEGKGKVHAQSQHTHTHRGSWAHHTLALLLTHDQSKTQAHTGTNRVDSTDWSRSPAASSFYCQLNWNYTHTHTHATSNWE